MMNTKYVHYTLFAKTKASELPRLLLLFAIIFAFQQQFLLQHSLALLRNGQIPLRS